MTVFDLLFLLSALSAIGALILALVATVRGQRARAGRLVRRLITGVGLYFGLLLLASRLRRNVF